MLGQRPMENPRGRLGNPPLPEAAVHSVARDRQSMRTPGTVMGKHLSPLVPRFV